MAKVLHERAVLARRPERSTAWREQWRRAFRHRLGHVIRTSDALAEGLAHWRAASATARKRMMAAEAESGPLRQLAQGLPDRADPRPDARNFADTYAQTITYGLLTAAISRTDMSAGRHGTGADRRQHHRHGADHQSVPEGDAADLPPGRRTQGRHRLRRAGHPGRGGAAARR